MNYTKESLELLTKISAEINEQTFHHHYHILYDIVTSYNHTDIVTYVEIGAYAGGSACLVLQRPNTNVVSIDIGSPIEPQVVYENVAKLNIHNNNYTYLHGNSQDLEMVDKLSKQIGQIDVLFIDGDHSYQGVVNDFLLYENLVKPGGYIIFDDYNDWQYSPDVKYVVDDIVKTHSDQFKIIGTLPNIYGARPADLVDGNEFILRKL